MLREEGRKTPSAKAGAKSTTAGVPQHLDGHLRYPGKGKDAQAVGRLD